MTVRELIARLQELDPSGECLVTERRRSDYGPMASEDWMVLELYPQNAGEWYTKFDYRLARSHVTTSLAKTVHYSGN